MGCETRSEFFIHTCSSQFVFFFFKLRFKIRFGTTETLDWAEIVKHLAIINYRSRTSNNLKMTIKKPKKMYANV